MPAPTMSHVIMTTGLIIVIFAVQISYFHVIDNVGTDMVRRELKEITDYVADTIANLYFLANSTITYPSLEKTLELPLEIGGSGYALEITYDETNSAQTVKAVLQSKSWLNVNSWLPPGLTVNTGDTPPQKTETIESNERTVVAGCQRLSSRIYVWIAYKE